MHDNILYIVYQMSINALLHIECYGILSKHSLKLENVLQSVSALVYMYVSSINRETQLVRHP